MKIIGDTSSLQQIVARNPESPETVIASFQCSNAQS
jgi:hypothetical protein